MRKQKNEQTAPNNNSDNNSGAVDDIEHEEILPYSSNIEKDWTYNQNASNVEK